MPEIGGDGGIEPGRLDLLLAQLRGEALHLLRERLAILLLRRGADVATRCEHMAVLADVVQRGGLAVAGDVCVVPGQDRTLTPAPPLGTSVGRLPRGEGFNGLASAALDHPWSPRHWGSCPAPQVVGAGDACDVGVGKLAVGAIDHAAQLARVDEQHLPAAVGGLRWIPAFAGMTARAIAAQKPQAGRNLRRIEQLPRQGDHAVDQIGLDQGLADLALAGLVGAHAAVGQHEARHAAGREVVDHVLHPAEVGVAGGSVP